MSKSLLIYDNTGAILAHVGGNRIPQGGVQYVEIERKENQKPIRIDIEKNEIIFEKLQKTETEILKEKIESLEKSNAELTTLVSMQSQDA
ncbi:hypothetical protein [Clostridium cagae]|uniref:hypothetical protein n=1 Tax=Clostridium cagae TaxID=2080751 RepID=UPI000CF69371|nr:hypothetical protein [Clostridium cagae]